MTRHAERQERLGLTSEDVINEIQAESGAKVSASDPSRNKQLNMCSICTCDFISQVEMLLQQSGPGREHSPEEGFYPRPMEDYGEWGQIFSKGACRDYQVIALLEYYFLPLVVFSLYQECRRLSLGWLSETGVQ